MKRFLALFCLLILSISLSHADVIVNIVESDGDVVATASGTIDFDQQFGGTGTSPGGFVSGNGFDLYENSNLHVGTAIDTAIFFADSGNAIFNNNASMTAADSNTGDHIGLLSSKPGFTDFFSVDRAYVNGEKSVNATSTWNSTTLATLGFIEGSYEISAAGSTITLNIGSVDSTAPTLLSSTPADNATGVSTDAPTLSLVFDEPVSYASGVIRMYRTADDVEINNRSVSGSTGSGTANISISFENALAIGTEYYVLIPSGAFEDLAGNPYAGISNTTELSFTTAAPPPTYSVEGTVSGLTALGLVLQNNGGDDLDVFTNGNFLFDTQLDDGSAYAVTVLTNPPGQTCVVTDGSGTIAGAGITNVSVICTNNAFIDSALLSVDASKFYFDVVITDTAGETSGEIIFRIATEGDGIGGGDKQRIAINFDTTSGAVTRANEVQEFGLPPNDRWMLGPITDLSISPSASDGWQIVGSVLHGTEPYVAGDIVSDVQFRLATDAGTRNIHMRDVVVTGVSAPPITYSVGGMVSGLTGTGLALQNNGADTLAIASDGPFTFLTELADTSTYAVTISVQPTGQTCTVSNGSGTIATADVTNVAVICATDTYSVGGTVSGLTGTGLALQNNGAETLAVASDGPFTFLTELADTSTYAVTISAQPTGQTCTVSNGGGTIAAADVTNVGVTCVTDTYSVGGTVSGLTGTGLTLQNNGADTLAVATDGPFTFLTELTDTSTYAVTISAQPTGQTCSVSNGSGTIATADVTNVAVTCVTDTYSVGGMVSGLTGTGLALQNNGADTLAVATDGPFVFLTELADTSTYAVTISAQPTGQTCSVSNGGGTIATADVASIAVACVDNPIYVNEVPIPTLDRYGLALLMLLMLGIGAVGIRRFY